MKKLFALVVAAVLLSGCATSNPGYQNAQDIALTAGLAKYGYLKGGALWGVIGGLGGHQIAEGLQYKPPESSAQAANVIFLNGIVAPAQVRCPSYTDAFGYVPDGYRRTAEGLTQYGCGPVSTPGAYFGTSYSVQGTAPTTPTVAEEVIGPTVDDYLQYGKVDKECQLPDHGMAGRCLLALVPDLRNTQTRCDKEAASKGALLVEEICSKKPGVMAGIYQRLGNQLVEIGQKERGE